MKTFGSADIFTRNASLMCILLLLSIFIMLAVPPVADSAITVTASGPGGTASKTLSDDGGEFNMSLPLNRNAVNTISVTATDSFGQKASHELKVTQLSLDQIVVSKVTAERLSVEQIKQLVADGVINLDNPSNYNVSRFDIILTIGQKLVPISVSVPTSIAADETGSEEFKMPDADNSGAPTPIPTEILVFDDPVSLGGGQAISIPGVIIIEGNIKSLKEFYTVRLLLMNTSGIFTLKNVIANISFPDSGLSSIAPLDGIISFGDILPGDGGLPGQAERQFIIRGDEIGIRQVKVGFGGTVAGPGIPEESPVPFNGSAFTKVEVKGPPTFKVRATHPDAVEAGVPYEFKVEITNTGDIPALYSSLDLSVGADGKLVSCNTATPPACTELGGTETRTFGDILPGQTVSALFMIKPLKTGLITSCLGISDQNITLQVLVGTIGCLVGQFPPEVGVPDGTPTVSVVPTPNTLGVSIDSAVAAFFSQEMLPATVTTGSGGTFNVFDRANNVVPGTIRQEVVNGKTVAIWQVLDGITNRLTPNVEYTVMLTTGIANKNGVKIYNAWTSRFTTTGEALDDSSPPTLTLAVDPPVNPSYVLPGQLVKIDAYAADQGSGVVRVELRIKDLSETGSSYQLVDRKLVFNGDLPPYIFTVDSAKLIAGHTYQLMGTAYDYMMNAQNATINLVIAATAAAPTITLPPSPAVAIPQGISVSITPESITGGVNEVRYYLDGAAAPFKSVNIPPYQAGLGTVTLALGNHTIRAVALDALGQSGEATYTFTLAANPNKPQISLNGTANGATYIVGSSFVVSGTATDPLGIASVKYSLDNLPVVTSTQSFTINTAGMALGSHTISAEAVNAIGGSSTIISSFVVASLPNGPPPTAPVISSLSIPANGSITLSGSSVPGARIDITNVSQSISISVYATGSGLFSCAIATASGDQLQLIAFDYSTSQQPSPAATATVPAPPVLTGISAAPATMTFTAANAWQDITVTGSYDNAPGANVTGQATYSSSDPSAAAVSSSGRVVALKNGTATITALFGGKAAQVVVTVDIVTLTSISLDASAIDFTTIGQTRQLVVTGHYSNGTSKILSSGVSFTSGDNSVATAGMIGLVTAAANGATVVTAYFPGVQPVTIPVTINLTGVDTTAPVVSITAPAPQTPYNYGDTITLTLHATDRVGVSRIRYTTSGNFIASGVREIPPATAADASFTIQVPFGTAISELRIAAFALDTNGNEGVSTPVTVLITGADITPPATQVTAVADPGTSASTAVTYQVTSRLSDLDHVELYFRRNGSVTFNRYTDPDNGNPKGTYLPTSGTIGTIIFDSTKMGGDGTYEFYTVGIDKAGNRELPPLVADQTATFNAGTIWTVITTPASAGEGDTTYDNRNIRVNATTFTVNGAHTFKNVELLNGALLTHAPATMSTESRLDLTLWSLAVDQASAINTDGRGYLGGNRSGNDCGGQTFGNVDGSTYRSAGSYGGLGGSYGGAPNATYGSLTLPAALGSGGSCGGNSYVGGSGGGWVSIKATNLMVDGVLSANGATGAGYQAGSGSGGTISITAATVSGSGTISANGGGYEVGGGGGRIAITYQDLTMASTQIKALGGQGSYGTGGNGTVFFKGATQTGGDLIVDGLTQGTPGDSTVLPAGYAFDRIVLRNGAHAVASEPLQIDGILELSSGSTLTATEIRGSGTLLLGTGSSLTHPGNSEAGLTVQVKKIDIDATSFIDVTSKGYPGGHRGSVGCPGTTLGKVAGVAYRSGGSYGGFGGVYDGTGSNAPYGHSALPLYLGSGGSCGGNSYAGGNGGGLVNITAEELVVNGSILANGVTGTGYQAGSGSGGSIAIHADLLRGTGVIQANGGAYEVGGGGGRVAISYGVLGASGDDLNALRNAGAFGGRGNNVWGASGTVWLKTGSQQSGDLYIDGNQADSTYPVATALTHVGVGKIVNMTADTLTLDGSAKVVTGGLVGLEVNPNLGQEETYRIIANTGTQITVDTTGKRPLTDVASVGDSYAGVYRFDNVYLRRGGNLNQWDKLIVPGTMKVDEYSLVSHDSATMTLESHLDLTVGTLEITGTSAINTNGRGYLGGNRSGNDCSGQTIGNVDGSTFRSAGSYGGLGGSYGGAPNATYGSLTLPAALGSGGSCGGNAYVGGSGGGWVSIKATNLVVDGVLSANGIDGSDYQSGSGSGGTISITASSVSGSGTISANGGGNEVGGGGGRIAITYQDLTIAPDKIQALGGPGSNSTGGNGTVFLKGPGQTGGDLIVDGLAKSTPGDSTVLPAGYVFDRILLRNGAHAVAHESLQIDGRLELSSGSTLTATDIRGSGTLLLGTGSTLTHPGNSEAGLAVQAKKIEIDATSFINVTSKGYPGGNRGSVGCPGTTLGKVAGVAYRSGGSYGGFGGVYDGAGSNAPYGHPALPLYLGSGGSCGGNSYAGGDGGGLVNITVEELVVNGSILANGGNGTNYQAGSGSGGSIAIHADLLRGTGEIQANGGAYQVSGGGGRIAITYGALGTSGDDLNALRNVGAFGGRGSNVWGASGTVWLKTGSQQSGDLYIDGNQADSTYPVATALTHVGVGKIVNMTANTLTLDGSAQVVSGGLVDLEINPNLGQEVTYRIIANTGTQITVDTTGKRPLTDVASVGDSYAGVYRFDNVYLRRGGNLNQWDKLIVPGTMKVDEYSLVSHDSATMTLESHLDLTVGTLEITGTSAINTNGRGYLGGNRSGNDCGGQTFGNVDGSAFRSAGSYGGPGGSYGGAPNATYGSLTLPAALGSGGSCGGNAYVGGSGGGWVSIKATNLVVDGVLSANGATGAGYQAGSGSGGTISITAATVSGSGTISANGGENEVGGGGGRIAITYHDFTIAPDKIQALGGLGRNSTGGNGTVYFDPR